MSNIKYRKDIDGLRALAVLSVVLFHLNLSWVKSGFLGVDIFFVISGYLITSIIIRDLDNNSFSLKNFYLRRIRRILPALITVLIFSSFLAWLILLPQDLENYSESLVSAIASVSNLFFFIKLDFGYFGADSQIIPLLHTWSLGVEEQFYLLWPIVLIFLFKIGLSTKKKLFATSIILLILSCLVFLSGKIDIYMLSSQRWYYFPTHRAFELLFGCALAILLYKNTKVINNKLILNILSIAALILMIVPIFIINVGFPSFWTIIACFGATLFIYTGSDVSFTPIANKILSIKPFVAIGLISYSLYLWHWPIIAYVNYLSIEKTESICTIIFVISIILATLSYFLVEKPFRYRFKFSFAKSFIALWVIPLIISICFYAASINHKFGFNQPKINQNELTYSYGFENIDKNNCFLMIASSNFESKQLPDINKCSIGYEKIKTPNTLLIGDSHARSDIPMVSVWLKNIKQKAYVISQKTTPFIYDFKNVVEYVSVTDRNHAIAKLIKTKKYKYVILAGEWSKGIYSSSIKSLKKSIKLIIDSGATPIIILDTPTLSSNISNLCPLEQQSLPFLFNKHSCQVNAEFVKEQQHVFSNLIQKLKKQYPEMVIIDPKKAICNDKFCNIEINDVPIYADSNHLNYIGSKLLGEKYMKEYGNPLSFIKTP
ncbi:acyltransferase family protein [Francisella sp. 19X1-34]|uniref:acyltransferase family protein n=1 Tax=Francisella sp. 19X1-34 TaxID=3087177 RepID=UPI002E308C99|nr:acyltransferase family protein [Francisella sp. 19X1-34]MED7788475.1 acyltransferase family protein [Francisella sp. 19X1-34]